MRGSAMRLTQSFVNSASSLDKAKARFWDSGVPGLVLAVTRNGGKTYCAVYRDPEGRQREPRIGDAKVVTLESARKAAIELLATAQLEGRDPIRERRAAKAAAIERRQWTFEKLGEVYLTDGDHRRSPARVVMEKMYLRKHLAPRFNETLLADLTAEAVTVAFRERLSIIGEIVSRILNHTPPGPAVTLIYNRNSYLPQKRAALEAWAGEVERVASASG